MKISDFGKIPREASDDNNRRELAKNTEKLNRNFNEYMASKDPAQRNHLEKTMNEELSLMHALSQDASEKGLRKHQAKLEKDFKEYQKNPSDENYAKIKHDITELREYCAE